MVETISCILYPLHKRSKHPFKNGSKEDSILEIQSANDNALRKLTISEEQILKLKFGDRIKSITGTVFCNFNSKTGSRGFILSPDYEFMEDSKYRSELIIDNDTTNAKT